ncbi:MAG: glycine cleavage T C-terminal barrel domain-containing protein [Limibacillus sp.]
MKLEEPQGEQPLADPLGSESVWQEGRCIGSISSGGYGYAEGAWLGWAYVRPEAARPGSSLEVMTLGSLRRATVLDAPVFDPENARPRA